MYISVLLMIAINFTLHLNSFLKHKHKEYIRTTQHSNLDKNAAVGNYTHTHTQMRTYDDEHKQKCNNRKESLILLFVRYKGCDCLKWMFRYF